MSAYEDVCTMTLNSGVRPWSRTISCGGFDSLLGVVILELCWA